MEKLDTEDGQLFIKSLATFIRHHEKALANSLQLSVKRRQNAANASSTSFANLAVSNPSPSSGSSSSISAAFSFAGLTFGSHSIKPAHLTLTPHHLFYLLSRLEELDIAVGPMNVRLETLHNDSAHSNYMSFLQNPKSARKPTDKDSLHSVSSVRSVMSGMSAFWSSLGFGHQSASKSEKAKAAIEADLKYIYSAFTKLPALRLSTDHRARLIRGYEEFPFDTAVPLFAFKNVQQLDIVDVDFRQFHGWDRLAENLVLLTVKRANMDDPTVLLTNIVLDDMERRRKRSTKRGTRPATPGYIMPTTPQSGFHRSSSDPGTPVNESPDVSGTRQDSIATEPPAQVSFEVSTPQRPRTNARPGSSYRHVRTYSSKAKRSGSGSSEDSNEYSGALSAWLIANLLPPNKWLRLKYLSLADNSLTSLSAKSLQPLANSLRSLNLSSNLFAEIPDSLASLTRLNSLDLSNCMIESLHSLARNPLPAILTIKLQRNRLRSLAGVERLLSLENLDVKGNRLSDPTEAARLTGIPNLRRIWVKHNPFTKSHPDFRVTIFNTFRKTPGYTEDLIIDDYGPNYNERKYLTDRVPEVERPAASHPPDEADDTPSTMLHQPARHSRKVQEQEPVLEALRPLPRTTQSEYGISSTRRKRGPRRRIVDLSGQVPPERLSIDDPVPTPLQESTEPHTPTSLEPKGQDAPSVHISGSDDDYRQRVEALRQEFGSNWISVMSEQGWDGAKDRAKPDDQGHTSQLLSIHRANGQAIASGGRTLG